MQVKCLYVFFFCNISICLHTVSTLEFTYLIFNKFQSINTVYKCIKMEGFKDSIFLLRIVNKIFENEMSWQL